MRRAGRKQHYHHGDLRAALVDTAIELIAERGVAGFSLAEASRRLGVAVSAPYRHFADRQELLAAVAVRACEVLTDTVAAESADAHTSIEALVAAARGYVRFGVEQRALFEAAFGSALDRPRHPELVRATGPLKDAFLGAALDLSDGDPDRAGALALAVATTAHGHAVMAHLGAFGTGPDAAELAIGRAGDATRALLTGRRAIPPLPNALHLDTP
ncbi:TetR family transcriptional regulator [Actinocatenispora thailandica]|uniref:TetR family transcriptional regulator n=1 Tax=Actinocatenispora thailandica TaxID=227318 RepID=A0A7R7DX83_9ACTN|nr:TetR/AcrR family transcriptional regulator [Actinocatenispora thailandica]BCJ39062.1 TetR family transcriptional regulator [Actinocatenispora thailandica]